MAVYFHYVCDLNVDFEVTEPVFCYCVIVKVRLTLWVETAVPDVPVVTTVIWEVVGAGGAGVDGGVLVSLLPLIPPLEPQPSGHQKARANNAGLSGLCGAYFSTSCVAVVQSATLTPRSLPLSVT